MYLNAAIFFVRTDEKEMNQMRLTLTAKHFFISENQPVIQLCLPYAQCF